MFSTKNQKHSVDECDVKISRKTFLRRVQANILQNISQAATFRHKVYWRTNPAHPRVFNAMFSAFGHDFETYGYLTKILQRKRLGRTTQVKRSGAFSGWNEA